MIKKRFGLKIFITMLFLLILGLSMINLIFIKTFKNYVEETLVKEISLYQSLIEKGVTVKLPYYMQVTKGDSLDADYTLFEVKKDKFFFIRSDYLREIIGGKVRLMLYWDIVILFSVVLLYYFTLYRAMEKNNRYLRTFETVLMVFSHKIGNYLSISKLNIELLKSGNTNALKRIQDSNIFLEQDFNNIKDFVGRLNLKEHAVERLNLAEIIQKTSAELSIEIQKNVRKNLKNIYVNGIYDDIAFGTYLIMDNAKKYSSDIIHLRAGTFRGKKYFFIRNDVSSDTKSGLGVGLEVASKLFVKNGHKLSWKSGKKFSARVIFKNRFRV